jgi:hypothetical protein
MKRTDIPAQAGPLKPLGQSQINRSSPSRHVPPFLQGFTKQKLRPKTN